MSTHNTNGVEYAKLSEIKVGDTLMADDGFTCMVAGAKTVLADRDGPYVACSCDDGRHYLDGQADDGDHMVGFTKP